MIEMKEKELDMLCNHFEEMKFKAGSWWPTIDEIKTNIEPRLKNSLNFVLWITETADEPQTEEEKASKKYLLNLIYKNLKVVDEEE